MGMQIDGISFTVDSEEELADLLEELRDLWDVVEAGALEVGPALRAALTSVYAAAELRLSGVTV